MSYSIPLPKSLADLVLQYANSAPPGLWLDKFVGSWNPGADAGKWSERVQLPAVRHVAELSAAPPAGLDFDALCQRRRSALATGHAATFQATNVGSLTLHLGRAAALENAGICLHPLYGFAFLPGSGLKGMVRAYAETVWLPTRFRADGNGRPLNDAEQREAVIAWQTIEFVFGWAPGADMLAPRTPKPWKPHGVSRHSADQAASAGAIVFHDAWPLHWPQLVVDIVNNHHPAYYGAPDNDRDHPPGDWENPVPVYFLAVPPGVGFEFTLSKRRVDLDGEGDLLELAAQWLAGALCHLGAGAKSAAGYGTFQLDGTHVESVLPHRLVKVELVTPAFLGGPDRHAQESLRMPGIRAWLRQWWRACHGDLSLQDLRDREAKVFGSIERGTGLRVLHAPQRHKLKILPRGQDFGPGGSFLGYLGYGPVAYEKARKANLTQVHALAANQVVPLRLSHSDSKVLAECLKALWLATAFGGVGSRSRRGWGSLVFGPGDKTPDLPDLRSAKTLEDYRAMLAKGLEILVPFANRPDAQHLSWTALSQQTRIVLSRGTFANWRDAMEDLGKKFIQFRSRDKRGDPQGQPGPDYHKTKDQLRGQNPADTTLPERAAFGLPYAQAYSSLPRTHPRRSPTATFTPVWTDNGKIIEGRRASPLFCKIARLAGGEFLWQVAFLPSQMLPSGASVRGDRTDVEPKRPLPTSEFPPPGALGVARKGQQASATLLVDFLDFLEGKPLGDRDKHSASSLPANAPKMPAKPGTLPRKSKPVNRGQTRDDGTLRKRDSRWVVVFPGDDREAEIINPEKLPPDITEQSKLEFWIDQASKAGIQARFNRRLK